MPEPKLTTSIISDGVGSRGLRQRDMNLQLRPVMDRDLETRRHHEIVERQNTTRNIFLALNAIETSRQAAEIRRQTREVIELKGAIKELQLETERQTDILSTISLKQGEVLNEVKRSNYFLELSNSRALLERAAKSAVFRFKLAIEAITKYPTPLERYIAAEQLLRDINATGISFDSLPDISDKKFFHESLNALRSLSQLSAAELSSDEIADLRRLELLQEEAERISAAPDFGENFLETIKKIDQQYEEDIRTALLQNSICKGFTSRIHAVRRVA